MNNIREFVKTGKIGLLYLSISKKETLNILGEPNDWFGKDTITKPRCELYCKSPLWFYYGGCVGVHFGKLGTAVELVIYPDNFSECKEASWDWPINQGLTMGQWKTALQVNNLNFREGDPNGLDYWILAEETCFTYAFPFNKGNILPATDRIVPNIVKYANVGRMKYKWGGMFK
jgi:hypothetical protein